MQICNWVIIDKEWGKMSTEYEPDVLIIDKEWR